MLFGAKIKKKKHTHKIMILSVIPNTLKPNDPKEGLATADNNFVCR